MRAGKVLAVALATVFIAGCKTTVETELSISDLLTSETKIIPSNLYVEVAACNDHEDSRKPSSSLVKAQETVPTVFAEAKYEECFRKKFDSFARFTVPVVLDKDKDGRLASDAHINLLSNNDNLLAVAIPTKIKTNLDNAAKRGMGVSALKLNFNIKVSNDTGKKFPFTVLASYVENKPYVFENLNVEANSSFVIKLSDVSVSSALDNGSARVLVHADQ